ncbi:glycosyltransferase [Stieleria sp. TO1_6]|nr:glycosyltransferase [Stieleria tagensis]
MNLGIVAIARNEGDRLRRCLNSLLDEVESDRIVYVDSGSTDGSVELAEQLGVDVVKLDLSIPFTAARARNAGFARLTQLHPELEFVQFLDGDCRLQPGWLDAACCAMESNQKLAAVCGRRRESAPEDSIYNALIDREWNSPIGIARSCGGDALFRRVPLEACGGFNESIIAGEEPELCYRLRQRDWQIERIDCEMTLHDADLQSFAQWWSRAKRYGHAAFEGAWRYGATPEKFMRRQVRGIVLWGGVVWIAAAFLSVLFWPWGLLAWGIFPIQVARHSIKFQQHGDRWGFAFRRSLLQLVCKPAELAGGIRFLSNRLLGRSNTLIEYKSSPAS